MAEQAMVGPTMAEHGRAGFDYSADAELLFLPSQLEIQATTDWVQAIWPRGGRHPLRDRRASR
jgi:hypothetical protein